MRVALKVALGIFCLTALASAQTAGELVAKNIQAHGGLEKIKAVNTVRMTGRIYIDNPYVKITAGIEVEKKRGNLLRENVTIQGMTQVQAYDSSTGWQIQPFQGRKDPELMGDDDTRDLMEESDIDGPLVDYQAKGNKVEYLGHDTVDGDDVYQLKVTLKNGDIVYYYLDPDTYLEIKREKQQFIRGSVHESEELLGSYKQVAGVYYPYSVEVGAKNDPNQHAVITVEKIEVNVPLDDSQFKMPAAKK
jgi:outer membrane lipoprotein-sorting protein